MCDRTPQVGDEIVQQAGVGDCAEVEDRHLAAIQELNLCISKMWLECERIDPMNALREGDFLSLSGLRELVLAGNDLTALPEGVFSDLVSLEFLGLGGNELTVFPAGVFSGLASLKELNLEQSQGSPFTLTVEVTRTDSGDATSPGPATLRFSVAEGAPFVMTIPLSVRGGTLLWSPSASFAAGDTVGTEATLTFDGSGTGVSVAFGPVPTVCEDPESSTEGPKCSGLEIVAGDLLVVANPETVALSVPAAHLTQASQDLSGEVPPIAGRQALLRVFATVDERYIVGHEGRATFLVRGQEVHSASLEPPASGIPVDVEEGRLAHSFNARIPGQVPRPGLEMVVELDSDGVLPLKSGSRTSHPCRVAPYRNRRSRSPDRHRECLLQ